MMAGWLRQDPAGRGLFNPHTLRRSRPRSPGPGNGNGTLSLHEHAKRCVSRRRILRITILPAREFEAARPMLVRAAEKACLQRRFREALAFIRQALDIWSADVEPDARLRILQEMARCAMNCREHSVARLAWEEMFEIASDAGRLVEAHRQLAELDLREGCFDEAGHHLEIAAELAEKALAASEASRCWLAYADYLANRLLVRKAREAVASACRFAEKSEDPALISEATGYAGLVAAMCGRPPKPRSLVERALRIALDQGLPDQTALAYRRRANVCEYCADYVGETAAHLEAIRYCRRAGEKAGELSCLSCLAGAYFRTGEWKDASQTADTVLRDRKAHPAYQALARTVRAQLAAFRGEQRSAGRLLDRTLIELRQLGLVGIDFQVLWARAFYFENEGRPEMAAATYDEIRLLWRESEDRHLALSGLLFAAAFYAENDRSRDTADCLDILNTIAQDNNNPESRATLRGVAAEAARAEGDLVRRFANFRKQSNCFEKPGSRWRRLGCNGVLPVAPARPRHSGKPTAKPCRLPRVSVRVRCSLASIRRAPSKQSGPPAASVKSSIFSQPASPTRRLPRG